MSDTLIRGADIAPELKIAALAAQLAKEDAGRYRSLNQIASDAASLTEAGRTVEAAVRTGKRPSYTQAKRVAELYDAQLVKAGEVEGVSLGLRFWSGRCGAAGAVYLLG